MPIRKVGGGFKIVGVPGVHRSRAAVERQLRTIKASQAKKKGGKK